MTERRICTRIDTMPDDEKCVAVALIEQGLTPAMHGFVQHANVHGLEPERACTVWTRELLAQAALGFFAAARESGDRALATLDNFEGAARQAWHEANERRETRGAGVMEIVQSPTVRRIVGPTILLDSGSYFDFLDPEHSEFTIGDIAHGLSMTCRFAGQCRQFYSVAQHSVHVSEWLLPQDRYAGLMHDAAEAFIGDMSRPLKDLVPEYRVVEKRVEAAIFARFAVPQPLPPSVKEIDVQMLATEQRQLMRNRDDWNYTRGRAPLPFEIPDWSPAEAKRQFLMLYRSLRAGEGA